MTKKKIQQKKEIVWNLVNSGLAGFLVFLGGIASGNITGELILISLIAALIIAVTKFRDFWATEENEYTKMIGKFI